MTKKLKQNFFNYFHTNYQENNHHNNLKFNITNSNKFLFDFNKNYIYIIEKIKQKSNYFDLYKKNPLNLKVLDKKKENLNLQSVSITNFLTIYLKSIRNLNNSLISFIKINPLTSIFINKNKSKIIELDKQSRLKKNIKKQKNLELIEFTQNKKLKLIKLINLNKTKFQEKKIEDIKLTKLVKIKIEKNQIIMNNKKNKSENLFLKDNILISDKINLVNVINKPKSSILLLIKKLKQNKNKIKLVNFKSNIISLNKEKFLFFEKNIKKYINSKTSFNSKIAKTLTISNNYKFYKYNQISNPIKNNIYEFLYRSFISMFSIISKPVYIITPDKIVIQFFYLILKKEKINNNTKSLLIFENNNKLKKICNILTRFFNKSIELDLIRLYYPYFNSKILVNLFGIFLNKIQLRRIVNKFILKSIKIKSNQLIPSALSGMKIKVAGRLLTQRIIPRKTVKLISNGAISRNKAMFVETARFTSKNKRGAFSLTITIGHKLKNPKKSI